MDKNGQEWDVTKITVYEICSKQRTAKIYFKDGKFWKCEFSTKGRKIYDYDDWLFLGKISQKIKFTQETK